MKKNKLPPPVPASQLSNKKFIFLIVGVVLGVALALTINIITGYAVGNSLFKFFGPASSDSKDAEFFKIYNYGCIDIEKDKIEIVGINCKQNITIFNITAKGLCVIGKKNLNLNLENYESISAIIKTSNPVNITFFLHDGKIFSRATEPVLVSANEKKEVEVPFDMIHLWENDFNIENVREVWIGVENFVGNLEIEGEIVFK